MTTEKQAKLKEYLRQVAEILYKETPSDKLVRFETISRARNLYWVRFGRILD